MGSVVFKASTDHLQKIYHIVLDILDIRKGTNGMMLYAIIYQYPT